MMETVRMDATGFRSEQNPPQRHASTSHYDRIWHGHPKAGNRSQPSIIIDKATRRKKVTRESTSWVLTQCCWHRCAQKLVAPPASAGIAALSDAQSRYRLIPLFLLFAFLGTIMMGKLGDYARAIADYVGAIEIERHYSVSLKNGGDEKEEIGQYNEAIADYDRAIARN